MSIPYTQSFRQVFQKQQMYLLEFEERLHSLTRGDDFEMLMREVNLQRSRIAESIKRDAEELGKIELIELQSLLNSELDERIWPAIEAFIEQRTRSLTEQAQRDSLTKLFNSAAFDRHLREEIERARRYHRELSLVLFDIDRFKSVNDQFGHQAGDRVLMQVALILQSSLRQSDAAFRYGGDEFVAICPETSGEAMENVLRRINTDLRNYCLESRYSIRIGISWGIASFPDDASEVEALIFLADKRLYSCKYAQHHGIAANQ